MRKFTLFLCTLFASIGMIQAASNTPPETSTGYSDAKTYIIVAYRGGNATNPFLISASAEQLTGTTSKPESINNLLWFFVPANDNGGVYMCNWGLSSADSYAAISTTPLDDGDTSGKKWCHALPLT